MQAAHNTNAHGTAFTISIEATTGVSTGISAADRSRTIEVAADPAATASDLARPGHVFPLRAREGGVLVRGGQTEGIVDLAQLAGASPVGVICEIMNDDGTMARMPELEAFAAQHDLKICTIADLIEYRRRNEQLVEALVDKAVPIQTDHGLFHMHLFRSKLDGKEHVALTHGLVGGDESGEASAPIDEDVFVRVPRVPDRRHLRLLAMRLTPSSTRPCGSWPRRSASCSSTSVRRPWDRAREQAQGLLPPGRRARHDRGQRSPRPARGPAGVRDRGADLPPRGPRMRLLTNNPKKIHGLAGYGLELDQVPLEIAPNPNNIKYLRTKKERMGTPERYRARRTRRIHVRPGIGRPYRRPRFRRWER